MTRDEIFIKVQEVLIDALGVDDDEVTPESKLVGDLGAESIDFLDISFRLEKAFSIKIDQNEMWPESVLNDEAYVKSGKVTDEGMAKLKELLPHADLTEFDSSRSVTDFSNVFTVDAMVNFVERRVNA